jgi:hypothetical protein
MLQASTIISETTDNMKQTRTKKRNVPKGPYLCASGGKCEGICKERHLHRKRDWAEPKNQCPSAYQEGSVVWQRIECQWTGKYIVLS